MLNLNLNTGLLTQSQKNLKANVSDNQIIIYKKKSHIRYYIVVFFLTTQLEAPISYISNIFKRSRKFSCISKEELGAVAYNLVSQDNEFSISTLKELFPNYSENYLKKLLNIGRVYNQSLYNDPSFNRDTYQKIKFLLTKFQENNLQEIPSFIRFNSIYNREEVSMLAQGVIKLDYNITSIYNREEVSMLAQGVIKLDYNITSTISAFYKNKNVYYLLSTVKPIGTKSINIYDVANKIDVVDKIDFSNKVYSPIYYNLYKTTKLNADTLSKLIILINKDLEEYYSIVKSIKSSNSQKLINNRAALVEELNKISQQIHEHNNECNKKISKITEFTEILTQINSDKKNLNETWLFKTFNIISNVSVVDLPPSYMVEATTYLISGVLLVMIPLSFLKILESIFDIDISGKLIKPIKNKLLPLITLTITIRNFSSKCGSSLGSSFIKFKRYIRGE